MSDKLNKDDGFYSEISKLNFGNKPWNIIQSGTAMTLQTEIEDTLLKFASSELSEMGIQEGALSENKILFTLDEALKAILATVFKHLPENMPLDMSFNRTNDQIIRDTCYTEGYNTAITKMEKTLGADHE